MQGKRITFSAGKEIELVPGMWVSSFSNIPYGSVWTGTIFHSRNLPLWKLYWAIYRIAQDKKGFEKIRE